MSKISVACVQLEALGLARAEEALERALSMIDKAGQSQPDLMVLPECTYAAALPDIEQGIAGQMAWALTRYKEMAPNTHVVFNRQPHVYGRLVG